MELHTSGIIELSREEKRRWPNFVYYTVGTFYYSHNGREIKIPVNFLTDGATCAPDYTYAWLFHDYLYATHSFLDGSECTRQEADDIMYDILRNDRLFLYAWAFRKLSRMNIFWAFSRAWQNSGRRGACFKT
jgi:hypothetical protein